VNRGQQTMSLDSWVIRTRPSLASECIPSYLQLNENPPSVQWVRATSKEPEASVEWSVRGRKGRPVRIHCIRETEGVCSSHTPQWSNELRSTGAGGCQSVPYLKSHLQKCIRKKLTRQAVATMKQLLKLNVTECVRRLAVIMLEDVTLHADALHVLLWWTIVLAHRHKQQKVTIRCHDVPQWLCEWILGVVHVLSEHHVWTQLPNTLPAPTPWARLQTLSDTKTHASLRLSHVNAIYSLYLRSSYGGLKGDVALFEQAADSLWRGDTVGWCSTPIVPIIWESVDALPEYAWDLDAIDFHVVPRIFELVERGDMERERPPIDTSFEEETEGEMFNWKRMMWENGSATNNRIASNKEESYGHEVWKQWLPRARPLQKWLVYQSYQ
jgi:hypothetical protein